MSQVLFNHPRRGDVSRRIAAVPAVLALSWTLAACSGGDTGTAPATAAITRGDVSNGVTTSGALTASYTEELGFRVGGKLTSVKVKVGQRVQAGDVLARLDDDDAQHTLAQAEANRDAQAEALGRSSDDPAVQNALATLAQARQVVVNTRRQSNATLDADQAAIDRAKRQQHVDEDAKDDAEDAVDQLNDACDKSTGAAAEVPTTVGDLAAQAAAAAQSGTPEGVQQAAQLLGQLLTLALSSSGGSLTAVCNQVGSAQSAVTGAKQRVTADRTAVVQAEQKKKVDRRSGDLAVSNSQQGVVSARNTYNSAFAARPYNIGQQQGLVDAAQAQVDTAEKGVNDTVLRASRAGVVTAVNGTVGEYVSASSGTSALAPGSGAVIPGASTAGAAGASGAGAASPNRPGGSQFVVLSGVDTLQAVLPFEETDAARIKPGQTVEMSLDALPDLVVRGKVISVAPSATPISGIVSYYATVSVDNREPRMRDGQTARGTVLVEERRDVVTVPNRAVRQQGDASTVVVVDPNGSQRTASFDPGVVGPDRTEVLSGLTEGQRVVVTTGP